MKGGLTPLKFLGLATPLPPIMKSMQAALTQMTLLLHQLYLVFNSDHEGERRSKTQKSWPCGVWMTPQMVYRVCRRTYLDSKKKFPFENTWIAFTQNFRNTRFESSNIRFNLIVIFTR